MTLKVEYQIATLNVTVSRIMRIKVTKIFPLYGAKYSEKGKIIIRFKNRRKRYLDGAAGGPAASKSKCAVEEGA